VLEDSQALYGQSKITICKGNLPQSTGVECLEIKVACILSLQSSEVFCLIVEENFTMQRLGSFPKPDVDKHPANVKI
jgi:hypothetical protein